MIRLVLASFISVILSLPATAAVDIQEVETPEGLNAWLVEDHSIPFVALEIRFSGGASLDAPGKRGAINLMTALLEEGAADMDARDFARETDSLAATFGFSVGDDALSVSALMLTENRNEAIELLRVALVEPRFDEDAIERVRGQILSGIASDLRDPDEIANRAMDEILFGAHPYGSSLSGTSESVTALTRDDVIAAHKAVLARDRIMVGAVGDITAEELSALLDGLFAGLPDTGAPMPPTVELDFPGGVTVIPYNTPQSVARFFQPGMGQEHPDFFAAMVLNHLLGGGSFESRLTDEVREKRGLTYGVYAYLAGKDLADIYTGGVSSANASIAEAIEVIRDEWAKLARDGATAEEVDLAKTYLTGAYPLRFEGNGTIANILVAMQTIGLPSDYIATRNERVEAVTLEEVNRVARELLDPEALHFVVVGQPEGLESTPAN